MFLVLSTAALTCLSGLKTYINKVFKMVKAALLKEDKLAGSQKIGYYLIARYFG